MSGLLRALRSEQAVTLGRPAETLLAAFRAGEVAMVIDGAEHVAEYQAALGDALGFVPVPAAGEQTGSVVRVDGIAVSAASANSFGAQALALHLNSPEAQHVWSANTGRLPANASVPIEAPLRTSVAALAEDAPHRPKVRSPWNIYPKLEPLIVTKGDASAVDGQLDAVCAGLDE